MVLDASLLNTQHYKVRIKGKGEQSREGVAPPLHLGVVAIEKGTFGLPSTMVANFTLLIMAVAKQKQDDQLELTYSSYVKTQDVTLKTCRRRWMIGRSGERWSGISVLAARHDDDDYGYTTLAIVKIVKQTELFNFCMATDLREGKFWI